MGRTGHRRGCTRSLRPREGASTCWLAERGWSSDRGIGLGRRRAELEIDFVRSRMRVLQCEEQLARLKPRSGAKKLGLIVSGECSIESRSVSDR